MPALDEGRLAHADLDALMHYLADAPASPGP
jgi:hypothetical protein